MNSLFPSEKTSFDLPNASIEYYPNFFDTEKSQMLYDKLLNEIPWQQDDITVFGKKHPQPRLTALFGNEGKPYSYSNIVMHPHKWNPILIFLKTKIEEVCNENFTTVLLNLYRDGKDSNGWHADNEKELGRNPIIASVSFGEERKFQLKHITNSEAKMNLNLQHGSLLLMNEGSQIHYKHQIPKATQPKNARINLTFRTIL